MPVEFGSWRRGGPQGCAVDVRRERACIGNAVRRSGSFEVRRDDDKMVAAQIASANDAPPFRHTLGGGGPKTHLAAIAKQNGTFGAQRSLARLAYRKGRVLMAKHAENAVKPQPPPTNELFESERRFRLLVEGVVDYAIYMLSPTGIITNWNAGAQRIKGYAADEIVGQHFSLFYTPEDRAAGLPAQSLATALREGRFEAEGWRVRKGGALFLASVVIDSIYEDGVLIGFAKITRDVTERQRAHRALQDSERHFRLLVSSMTDYALYMLDPTGRVSSWNAGGERIKGYAPAEIIGQHFSRFYTESDQAAGRPARALSIAKETGRYEEEGWRVRKNGSFFWASVVVDPIRGDDGALIGFAKITRDITERREAQMNLERVQRQLAESQKMDALGQLTGGVAHDFNNLLMIVTGNIHTLKKAAGGDPKAMRAAKAIELAAERGASLTSQLLTFSRRQQVNPQAIDLRSRIESIREVLMSGLGGVGLVIEIAPDAWPVVVDVSELEIALVNLVVNARDAMPEGGVATITAKNIVLKEDELVPPGEYVAIVVEDTGVGVPADIIANVFDPFFTTKPVGKGTGLGLSQVYGFAHQAGGAVKIASTLGKGAAITIYLPRAQEDAIDFKACETGAPQPNTGTVLLVEDNPEVANASAALLEQLGYAVRWAPNAETALQEIDKGDVDIVVSDIVMPGRLDGLGLARIIKQKFPALPILMATGYSEAAQSGRAEFPILRKPYQMHELSRALAALRESRSP
jgi:PAS domain S-box-containing protein